MVKVLTSLAILIVASSATADTAREGEPRKVCRPEQPLICCLLRDNRSSEAAPMCRPFWLE